MRRKLLIGLLFLLGIIVIAVAWVKMSRPRYLTDKVYFSTVFRWSKDGQSLYYLNGERLLRYDCRTRRRHVVLSKKLTPYFNPWEFDISPDEKSLVIDKPGKGLYIFDLVTHVPRKVLTYHNTPGTPVDAQYERIGYLRWLPDNRIVDGGRQLDLTNHRFIDLTAHSPEFVACDGSGFLYSTPPDPNIYVYSWKTQQSTWLPQPSAARKQGGGNINWKYLSSRYAIYYTGYHSDEKSPQRVACLDLTTMQERTVVMPVEGPFQEISPNMKWFYYNSAREPGEWIPMRREGLYVYPFHFPPACAKE